MPKTHRVQRKGRKGTRRKDTRDDENLGGYLKRDGKSLGAAFISLFLHPLTIIVFTLRTFASFALKQFLTFTAGDNK
jgi:hypothetical protein